MPTAPPDLVARLRAAGCVFAEDEAALLAAETADPDALEALVARRVAGEPLEHVLGWVAFAGLRLAVGRGAFIPRRRSALLVDAVRSRLPAGARVAELCCGVGAIGAALLAADPALELHASDVDPAALEFAERNLGGRAAVVAGDLYAGLPPAVRGRFDAIVASPPYVPSGELRLMPGEAREHEPRRAHDGGADGLELARRIVADARGWLAPGGILAIETAEHQTADLTGAMRAAGYAVDVVHDPESGGTATIGTRTPAPGA